MALATYLSQLKQLHGRGDKASQVAREGDLSIRKALFNDLANDADQPRLRDSIAIMRRR
jgi:hypothetical protein